MQIAALLPTWIANLDISGAVALLVGAFTATVANEKKIKSVCRTVFKFFRRLGRVEQRLDALQKDVGEIKGLLRPMLPLLRSIASMWGSRAGEGGHGGGSR